MPFTAADGREKVTALQTKPADLTAVTVTEAEAGVDIHWHVAKSDFRLSPTGSTTFDGTPLGSKSSRNVFSESNAEGTLTVFRDLDETGKPATDSESEDVFDLVKAKGTELWVLVRKGPDADEPWAAEDEYSIYYVRTDDPQNPTDRSGYIRYTVPLSVQEFEQFQSIAAAA